ncbi:NAD-dependent dihydroorotate dehydrogenase B electron transfer subunit [bacterium]|nr:NAD-dependent dihydroorotate dehydrogenase B electron transfer subunit [bacterium]
MSPDPRGARTPSPTPLAAVWRRARVTRCAPDGALYWDLRVEAEGLPAGTPGQFSLLAPAAPGAWDPLLPRPLSLLDAGAGWQRFLFKVVGRGTAQLAALRAGDRVGLLGPLGRAFGGLERDAEAAGEIVLVGGGVGIPPLHFLARRLSAAGRPCRALFGFNREAEIPRALLAALDVADAAGTEPATRPAAELCTLDGSAGVRGNPVARLVETLGDGPLAIKACGPAPMLAALRAAARAGDALELSLEERMACGVGVCRGCVVPVVDGAGGWRYAAICREGPVFDAASLAASAAAIALEPGHE